MELFSLLFYDPLQFIGSVWLSYLSKAYGEKQMRRLNGQQSNHYLDRLVMFTEKKKDFLAFSENITRWEAGFHHQGQLEIE